jgi:hypothetical protein
MTLAPVGVRELLRIVAIRCPSDRANDSYSPFFSANLLHVGAERAIVSARKL